MKYTGILCTFLFLTIAIQAKVRYQKVTIYTDSKNEIYIDGEKATPVSGKYLLEKNQKTHEIVAKREGYKDEVISAVPYLSNGYLYASSFTVGKEMTLLPTKLENAKNLRINAVAIDLKNENNKIRIFTNYATYLRKKEKIDPSERKEQEDVESSNTIFSDNLNDFLKTVGFIDTSDNVFNDGFLNNLITDVKVTEYTYHRAPAHYYYEYGGMAYVEIKATWTLMDIYDNEIYSTEGSMRSGFIPYNKNSEISDATKTAITDALTSGLIEFMNDEAVKNALKDKSDEDTENNFSNIPLVSSAGFASTLGESIKSSVTVKSKDSHGSGFFVSSDGYIITNYHVICKAEDLSIVTNDGNSYDVTVERESKIHDLALLKIDITGVKPLKISPSTNIEVAADIFAVGTPQAEDLSQTVSKGIISGTRKTDQDAVLMQIDASINSGNSGGAIVSKDGTAIGVVSAKLFGFGIEGVGFGIPAYQIINKLKVSQ